jgi:hypothetical protein
MTALLLALALQDGLPEPVRAIAREFCADCHAEGSKKGGFALEAYASVEARRADRPRWAKAVQLLQSHVMPPVDRPQPTAAQRKALLDWIERDVFPVDPERPDPGRTSLRRLNRTEYDNAVRDVFGVDSKPAAAFPPDDSGYGFDTVGDALTLSPALLEKVLAAARQTADEATRLGGVGQVGVERLGAALEVFRGKPALAKNVLLLNDLDQEVGVHAEVRADAVYRILVVAGSSGPFPARLQVLRDGLIVGALTVEGTWEGESGKFKAAYLMLPLQAGRRRISIRLGEPADGITAAIQAFRVRGPFSPAPPPRAPFLERLVGPERAIVPPRLALSGEDLEAGEGKSSLDTGAAWFSTRGFRRTPLVIPEAGRYRFRVKAGAQQLGDEKVKFELRVAGKAIGPLEVAVAEQRTEWVEAEADLDAGTHDLQVWFVNAFRDEAAKAERFLWVHEFTVDGPLGAVEPLTHAELPWLLAKTARRLFRRPLKETEAARLAELARRAEKAGQGPDAALRLGLVALLSSPQFLYWNPPAPSGAPDRGSVAIDEFALASRLSAFLWSSVPDEELLGLAQAGELRAHLRSQVSRMLMHPRSVALREHFAGQWLELRTLALVTPDAATFPGWSAELAADLRRETELLFDHVLRANRPVLELLTADYTFANERVARHYGLKGVEGEGFRRVPLAGTPRRGLLTHGSLLTLTSHPNRTSPVKRGKFVLEKILGTPPPPAPRDVPPLPEVGPDVRGLTMRKRLEVHRENKACASCHAFMDPPGFAFEQFDAVGRWRDVDEGAPVDASGRFVSGEAFRDHAEFLAAVASTRADDVVRALAEQLLTYAIGRGIEYTDRTALAEILEKTRPGGRRFQDLIVAVCESVPFQRMRIPDGK